MKGKTFENMLKNWKENQLEKISRAKNPKTAHCLSFERFAAGNFTQQEKEHLQSCSYCNKMNSLFSQYVREGVAASILEREEKTRNVFVAMTAKLIKRVKNVVKNLEEFISPMPIFLKVALPVLVAVILIVALQKPAGSYAKIARVEYYAYEPIAVRDARALSASEQLFNEGMIFYQKKSFRKAIQVLRNVVQKQPNNVNGHFYLGLCYLYEKQVDEAINQLNLVLASGNKIFFEKCYWYLGNAYLLEEKPDKAVEMFEKVVEMEGDYQWEGRKIIEEIKNIK